MVRKTLGLLCHRSSRNPKFLDESPSCRKNNRHKNQILIAKILTYLDFLSHPPTTHQLPLKGYRYDAVGNRTRSLHQSGAWGYDQDHSLTTIELDGQEQRYAPFGRRIAKRVAGITSWYL